MSGFKNRSVLFGSTFLVLALAGPSLADQPQSPGFAPAKMQMVHMRGGMAGPGGKGMLPLARLACGDNAEADIAAFQSNLASGLNLSDEQQALVASIIEKMTSDTDRIARMCEHMDRLAERGWGGPKQGKRGWGDDHGMKHGDDMEDEDDDEDEDDNEMRAPGEGHERGFWGRQMGRHMGGHKHGGHEGGHERGHGKERAGGPGLERLLNNPALSEEDKQALEAIVAKLRTAAQEKQKERHELRGLMMELRHSLTNEQEQIMRKGGFQQFLPKPADTKA